MVVPGFHAGDIGVLARNAERASALLRVIGSKWRLLIVCHLVTGEKTVTELEQATGLRQSALSQNLMVLRHRDLVNTRRVAQNVYYSLNSAVVTDLILTLHRHYCEEPEEAEFTPGRRPSNAVSAAPKRRPADRQRAAKPAQRARLTGAR
jgi:DNA-binding transcriptional ArsR family regulator